MASIESIIRTFTFSMLVLIHTTKSSEIGNPSSSVPQLTDQNYTDVRSRDKNGYILKHAFDTRELFFYETVYKKNNPVKQFILEYHGCKAMELNGITVPYMRFKNLTENFTYPCVLKIHMGLQILQPMPERTMKEQFSFSITSYDCENLERGEFEEGSNIIRAEDVIQTLYRFVNKKLGLAGLVPKILEQLRSIKLWFDVQEEYRFEDSSIIIVYDAADLKSNEENLRVHVRMFDFFNVTRSNTKDVNYIQALDELIQAFDNLDTLFV